MSNHNDWTKNLPLKSTIRASVTSACETPSWSRDSVLQRNAGIYGGTSQRVYNLAVSSLVFAILSPVLLLKTGHMRKLLLAIIVLDIPLQVDTHFNYRSDAA